MRRLWLHSGVKASFCRGVDVIAIPSACSLLIEFLSHNIYLRGLNGPVDQMVQKQAVLYYYRLIIVRILFTLLFGTCVSQIRLTNFSDNLFEICSTLILFDQMFDQISFTVLYGKKTYVWLDVRFGILFGRIWGDFWRIVGGVLAGF